MNRFSTLLLLAAGVLFVSLALISGDREPKGVFTESEAKLNAALVEQRREQYSSRCTAESAGEVLSPPTANGKVGKLLRPGACAFTFLDLGANVGDSMGKFIDAGMPDCSSNFAMKYNVDEAKFKVLLEGTAGNRLTKWAHEVMHEASKQVGATLLPENYCYFGVEGNKAFTGRLRSLEYKVMNSIPRPLRQAHFFTETVATGVDGRTKLFLDVKNSEQNYWGSSIYQTHPDVNGKAASVEGISLTTLIERTTVKNFGNHLIIKMDIEGAEYVVLNQAYDSGVLCQYAENAVRVDLIVETHKQSVLDEKSAGAYDRFRNEVRGELARCGVRLLTVKDAGRY